MNKEDGDTENGLGYKCLGVLVYSRVDVSYSHGF